MLKGARAGHGRWEAYSSVLIMSPRTQELVLALLFQVFLIDRYLESLVVSGCRSILLESKLKTRPSLMDD